MEPNHNYFSEQFHNVGNLIDASLQLRGLILPMLPKCCFGTSPFVVMFKPHQKDGASSGSFLELERARNLCGLRVRGGLVVGCVLAPRLPIILH